MKQKKSLTATPLQIPDGWRKLRHGTTILIGDRTLTYGKWNLTVYPGYKVGQVTCQPYIRRIEAAKPSKRLIVESPDQKRGKK